MTTEVYAQLKKTGVLPTALPWFLVMGSPGCGKSTLLHNVGLHFSWEHRASDSCTWFFSDKAILCEINTDISQEESKSVVDFLKKVRPQCPLSGIIVVIHPQNEISVKSLRAFLSEFTTYLGYIFPVTVCFTHIDTLTGFSAYFDANAYPVVEYQENLYEQLFSAVFHAAHSQQSVTSLLNVLRFPDAFQLFDNSIQVLLAELKRDNPYEETPDCRAVFLTGFSDKPYFMAGVFDRILQEGASTPLRSRKKLGFLRWITSVSIMVASVIVIGFFLIESTAFAHDVVNIREGVRLGKNVEGSTTRDDFVNLANYLSSHPAEVLISPLSQLLLKSLDNQIMPNLFHAWENHLALLQEQWALATPEEANALRGKYYNQLKMYLMFCTPAYRYPAFYQDNPMLAFYLNHSDRKWTAREDLIELSRQQLSLASNNENVYAGLTSWGAKQVGSVSANDEFGVRDLSDAGALSLFYTAKGFERYALPEINRLSHQLTPVDWVMQKPDKSLKEDLLSCYKRDYKSVWITFLQTLQPTPNVTINAKVIKKIMAVAHQNILFENIDLTEYFKRIPQLSAKDNSALSCVNNTVQAISDPQVREAIKNVLLLPLRAKYQIYLDKTVQTVDADYRSRVYVVYKQALAQKYPFMMAEEEVTADELNHFFDVSQGVFGAFVREKISPLLAERWLGMHAALSEAFLQSLSQAKQMTTGFDFELYPEPTVGLKEIRLVTNNQTYRYRNDPQEWQRLHWELGTTESDTELEIITSNGGEGNIECNSPWGLFRLLQKAELTRTADNSFRARWKIRADNGHVYSVSFLLRGEKSHNLFSVFLFERFSLASRIIAE